MAPNPYTSGVGGAAIVDGVVVLDKERTMNKKSILVSQVIMTFIMAATMSGAMGPIFTGPSMDWLTGWPRQFLIAWPIAFVLTMVAWPASLALTRAIVDRGAGPAPGAAASPGAR